MIIVSNGFSFDVEHEREDGDIYLSSVTLGGVDIIDCIKQKILDDILDQVLDRLKEENEEAEFENAIDDWEAEQ